MAWIKLLALHRGERILPRDISMHLAEIGLTGDERKRAYETVIEIESFRLQEIKAREESAQAEKQNHEAMRKLMAGEGHQPNSEHGTRTF